MDSLIPDTTEFVLGEIKEFLKEDKIDELDEEYLSQYLQSLLQIIEINIKNSEKTIVRVLKDRNQVGTLKELLRQALHFNPNMPDFLEFEETEEEDGRFNMTLRGRRIRPRSAGHELESQEGSNKDLEESPPYR